MSKSGQASVTLQPGETWIADQQCMTYYAGNYLADWVPLEEGDPWENSLDRVVEVLIDYGEDP